MHSEQVSDRTGKHNASFLLPMFVGEVALVFGIYFIQAAWPVPAVNEAHYLGKAKHYWNPAWCANDFFLNTADAHQMFYWSVGWLTKFFSLPAVAWIGRVAAWLFLALAWVKMSRTLLDGLLLRIVAAALFITLLTRYHLAGEWVISGIEAKCFAFGFGFLGIGALLQDRWNWVWLWFGMAAAFHALVGGWLVVCGGLAWLVLRLDSPYRPLEVGWWGLAIGGLLSLPGLIPAVLLTRGVDPRIVDEATHIYVVERLPHHLLPQSWPWEFLMRFCGMVVGWLVLGSVLRRTTFITGPRRRLVALVNAGLVLSLMGMAIAWCQPWLQQTTWSLLRYYWFRTADVLLPLGVALAACCLVTDLLARKQSWGAGLLLIAIGASTWHLAATLSVRGFSAMLPADQRMVDPLDWQFTCRWIGENTPADVVFLTPRLANTFRWHANRAEVVSWKDVPQDAPGIVEWWQRNLALHARGKWGDHVEWRQSLTEVPPEKLIELGRRYGARYVVTEANPPLPLPLIGPAGGAYAIYDLAD